MTEEELTFEESLQRIQALAEELTGWPDQTVAQRAAELLDWIDAFHRDGLGRLVEMVRSWRGEIFLEAVTQDPYAGTLLAAYGLGENEAVAAESADAVDAAIEEVRPMIESHGGSIEVHEVADGVVKVRLQGTCDGCPSSSATLTYGVEAALREHWPLFRRLEVVDASNQTDPAKEGLTCGVPAPEGVVSQAGRQPGAVSIKLTRRPSP